MKLAYASLVTAAGAVCEDRVGAFEVGDSLVVYVADGAGGVSGGAEASRRFVQQVEGLAKSGLPPLLKPAHNSPFGWVWMAFMNTDVELRQKAFGETTGIVVVIEPDGLVGASAGDSEAWLISGDRVDDLTAGQQRHRLGRASIFGADPTPFERKSLGGTLVAGTDGLFKYASPDTICRLAALPPEEACRALTDAVRLPNGTLQDDVGIVVARTLPD